MVMHRQTSLWQQLTVKQLQVIQYKTIQKKVGKIMTAGTVQRSKYLGYVKLTTNTGNSWTTAYNRENVTREEIASYYMGNVFNLGIEDDLMETVTKVEFLD